ncbi:hypothetical protein EMIHUDRAFT_194721 [Emiliania huxleyi CCMP1516]|uniref:Uncharacterized protein n=2 Tax=Emiliania huxleyi TaxID=2903 RepID=A0A0D3L201_EMIH1|nr:hypothetical protein EMIHUDRAFT_194721 [Emiliania huxleyi CCMP1516]EOD42036.1 hypothetical protein EMIHUDRAFT_194721 [Emiliania huxleyi CCMP1516]|eukprot:XP_005794465.1 hypothetical protein EMIHUDRAFT_194721 [Emiliania huxleyi CCMP1516]
MGEPVPPRWAGQRLARAGHSGGAAASSRSSSARPPLGVAASDGDGAWLRADVLPERVWRQQQLLARRLRRGSTILRKQGFVGRVFVERWAARFFENFREHIVLIFHGGGFVYLFIIDI